MIEFEKYGYNVFFIVFILGLLIELTHPKTIDCIYLTGNIVVCIQILHHFFTTFTFYGWLLPNKYLLFLFILTNIIVQITWYFNDGCIITQYVNKKCNIDIDENLHDILWSLNLGTITIFNYTINIEQIIVSIFLLFGIYHFYYIL